MAALGLGKRRACSDVCSETVGELLRVLSYPKFKLNAPERALLLQDYLPAAEIMSLAGVQSIPGVCRDPYDNVFLALAHHAGVDLVSGDADLTVLRDTSPVRIISVADLYETLHSS